MTAPAPWTRVAVRPSAPAARAAVSAAMFGAGAQGLLEEGGDCGALVTHVASPEECAAIEQAVRVTDPGATIETARIAVVDWSVAWRDSIRAHELGALTVAPPWLADGMDPARTVVVEPAMAFGTGDHPTTRGVLRLMQGVIRAGDVVADLGAG
ncbi:MAG: 50S ribosomal protein L11 methyltransferase, partial [Gemmatimonadales bacterium]